MKSDAVDGLIATLKEENTKLKDSLTKVENALRRIAFKANMRRNVKDPLPIKTFLSQSNFYEHEIWMLVESLADIAISALQQNPLPRSVQRLDDNGNNLDGN